MNTPIMQLAWIAIASHTGVMEPMIVEVRDVRPIPRDHWWVGTVFARSRERLAGAPRVTLTLHVRFEFRVSSLISEQRLPQLAREEALRFLDIA